MDLKIQALAELERRRRLRDLETKSTIQDQAEWGRRNPAEWIHKVLGLTLEPYQARIAESVRDNRRTAVASAHSVGKDFTAAAIVIWFLQCHWPSKVITTAPTDRQVKEILWAYIREQVGNALEPLAGRTLTSKMEVSPNHFALGFTSSNWNHNAAQGYHSDNILVIYDESSGVEGEARKGLDSALASGSNARCLDIANPTNPSSTFASLFDREDVERITISAFDTPNFLQFGITEQDYADDTWRAKITEALPAPYLCTPEWVGEEWAKARGDPKDDDWLSRVMGIHPDSSTDAMFPASWVRAAMLRGAKRVAFNPRLPMRRPTRGLDVARLGRDDCVAADYYPGWGVAPIISVPRGDLMATAGWVVAGMDGLARVCIDADGVGAGVYDRVREVLAEREGSAKADAQVTEVRSGRKAIDPTRYPNRRSEMLFVLKDMLDPNGEIRLALPPDPVLRKELCAIRWERMSDGRRRAEPKKETVKRLGHSPDRADAVAYSVAGGGADVESKTDRRRRLLGHKPG